MPIKKKLAIAHEVNYLCDDCGKGVMRSMGICLLSNPPQYPHRCNVCEVEKIFNRTFPRIEYVVEEDTQ
jgi:hypothetical protein